MAVKYNSANDPNFTTSIGGAPAAADTVNINKFSIAYNAGLSVGANKAALFTLHPQSQCEFGAAGGLVCKTDRFANYGSQQKLIVSSTSSAAEITTFINSPARGTSVTELGTCLTTGIFSTNGVLTLLDSVDTSGDVEVSGGDVTVVYSATLLVDGTLRVVGGTCRLWRRAETIEIGGSGTVTLSEALATQGDITLTGGTLVVEDSGTIDTIDGRAGTIDLSRLSRPITVASWIERPGLTVIMSKRTPTVTKTSSVATYGPARVVYID